MHLYRVSLIGAIVALSLASPVRGQPIDSIFTPKSDPKKSDQNRAKQERDTADCRRWAALRTGFDPTKETTSSAPPPRSDKHLNSAPGAWGRALNAGRGDENRRREDMERKRRLAEDAADLESQREIYDRTVKTCLEGRRSSSTEHDLLSGTTGEPGP